jgi:hypothetical protein
VGGSRQRRQIYISHRRILLIDGASNYFDYMKGPLVRDVRLVAGTKWSPSMLKTSPHGRRSMK